MEPDQLLVVDAGVVTDAAVEQPVGGEAVTGGMLGGAEAGAMAGETAGVVGGTTGGGDAPVAGEVVAEGGTTAGEVGGDVTVTAGTEGGVVGGVSAGVVAGETAGDVAQGGEQVEEEVVCDEAHPETCVCEPTEENVNFQQLGERIQKNVSEIDMMKEMEDYRKEYIGNVSHELKTPLFSIQGYVETLKDGAVENLNIRDKYLERIGNSVERLLNIVTDLDQISKYEAAEISINYSVFDINALTKEIFDLLEIEAHKKSAKLVLQTSQTAIMVRADKQKISQVLTNLISNAIHYSNREEALIKVITKTEQEKVKIIVQDNGMGIKPEVLPRIFERFYRVETSRNRKDGGSGLGLAIVKHILEAHHQSITVESKYLEGTLFTFYLEKAL